MRRIALMVGAVGLAVVPLVFAAPLEGPDWFKKKVEGKSALEFTRSFAGGQRACVLVIGDHDPVVEVSVTVYDKQNRIVAQDKGSGPARDFVTAIWYPARSEPFRIVVENFGTEFNACSIAIK